MFPLKDSVQLRYLPLVTWLLIITNLGCFAMENCLSAVGFEELVIKFGVVPSVFMLHLNLPQAGTVFSSMFIHADIAHIAGNMWFLWIFGDGVEDRFGHARYMLLYLGTGFVAAVAQILASPYSAVPMIGASGAISGVLGAYFYLFPRATVSTVFLAGLYSKIIELPSVIYLGLWFLMQFFSGIFSSMGPSEQGSANIAFWAHSAGFLSGLLAAKIMEVPEESLCRTK